MRLKLDMTPCLLVINASNTLGGSPPFLFYVDSLYSNMNFSFRFYNKTQVVRHNTQNIRLCLCNMPIEI